jgi:hypothetical protein
MSRTASLRAKEMDGTDRGPVERRGGLRDLLRPARGRLAAARVAIGRSGERPVRPRRAQDAGADELNLTGAADALMEADFVYNVADWEPEVNYDLSGDTGELSVEQGRGEGVPTGDARSWTS